ncbi:MAG: tetratricopeptide repeat protein [Bacteroidales bacterium]
MKIFEIKDMHHTGRTKPEFPRKWISWTLAVLFSLNGVAGQGSELLRKSEDTRADSAVKSHRTICDSLFNESFSRLYTYPAQSRELILKVIDSLQLNDTIQLARYMNLVGASYHIQANYGQAVNFYLEAINLAKDQNQPKRVADILNNLGASNLKMGNHKDAMDFFLKAINQYAEIGDLKSTASTYNNIGLLYMDIDNYDKARANFQIALKRFAAEKDSIGIAATLSNIGILYAEKKAFDSALLFHDSSMVYNYLNHNKYGQTVGFQGIANVYKSMGDYEQAIGYYNKTKHIAKEIDQYYTIAYANLGLAEALIARKLYQPALLHADSAMEIATFMGHIKLKQESHDILADIFEKLQQPGEALRHLRASISLQDDVLNQSKLHQIYSLEIEQLSLAKEVQQLEIQRQELLLSKKNNIIAFILVIFSLLLIGLYLLYVNYNHRRKANLQKTIVGLKEKKARAATEAELQERRRIGQDLHDGLGQMLSVARLNISILQQKSGLSDEKKHELLEVAMHSVDEAFQELRNIAHNLAPTMLTTKGFLGALKDLTNQINQSNHLKMKLETYGLNGKMDDILENTLYRAIQELISNAIKHSGAKEFFVQVVKSDLEINLMVEDDGMGFDINNALVNPGSGLNNIRSRVENINGNIFIDSLPNRGTIVSIVIPLKKSYHAKETH